MGTPAEHRAASDKMVTEGIRKYGCHLMSVFDPEDERPTSSYSVGILETIEAPESNGARAGPTDASRPTAA